MNLDESEHYPPGPKIAYSYQNNPHRDPPNMRKISTNSQTYSVFLISFYFLSVYDYKDYWRNGYLKSEFRVPWRNGFKHRFSSFFAIFDDFSKYTKGAAEL